ncbi:MAG TPA: helix-turn-helix domain-containing protein [Phycisphaerales bacterium]|nr:helix-turn-helix domain-containing protein [Phycisphaerales bacterium]
MRQARRSVCPVACTLDIIGDKWTLLVVRDLALGKSQFKEFMASPERIATNILTDRLGRLLEHGLVERRQSPEHEGREVYVLTGKGESLIPLLRSIALWGLEHIKGTEARLAPGGAV